MLGQYTRLHGFKALEYARVHGTNLNMYGYAWTEDRVSLEHGLIPDLFAHWEESKVVTVADAEEACVEDCEDLLWIDILHPVCA